MRSLQENAERLRRLLKRGLLTLPVLREYHSEKQRMQSRLEYLEGNERKYLTEREICFEAVKTAVAESTRLTIAVQEQLPRIQFLETQLAGLTAECDSLRALLKQSGLSTHYPDAHVEATPEPQRTPVEQLIDYVSSGDDLFCIKVQQLSQAVEEFIETRDSDKVSIHREIGKAIFGRSATLYSGNGLPGNLRRYTYPPFISIALSSHCNAACFFCRGQDYKGSTVDFDNISKLGSAARNARIIDLTGWGEPFFYPHFEEVVEYISAQNKERHIIQVTTNGSFLSKKWAQMLSGKIARLVISLNAATADTYATQMRYKNSRFTFDNTVAQIQEFQIGITAEDRKRMILHMVANADNFREISGLVMLAAKLRISVVNIGNYICAHEEHLDKVLWNVKEEYNAELRQAREIGANVGVSVWGRSFFTDEAEVKGAERCMAPFEQFFIEMPGSTAPCCFMGAERMGNVYETGFEKVWFSDIMNKLRESRSLPPCKVCTVFSPFDSKIAHMSAFLTTLKGREAADRTPHLRRKSTRTS
jgi:MoaA/NifB/PqqE/SkfB family radical SAM enzyme